MAREVAWCLGNVADVEELPREAVKGDEAREARMRDAM